MRSAISWNGLRLMASASSRTMMGGLSVMTGASALAVKRGAPGREGPPAGLPLAAGFFLSSFFSRRRGSRRDGMPPKSMKPTCWPTFGPAGVSGSAGSGSSVGASASGSSTGTSDVSSVASVSSETSDSTCSVSSAVASVSGGSGSSATMSTGPVDFSSAGAVSVGVSVSAEASDSAGLRSLASCSSRYSAVILSSELEATLALVILRSLALARTSLLWTPRFLAIS